MTLSTAAVGALFFGLIGSDKLPIANRGDQVTLMVALICMVAAVLCGLVGWAADAMFYNYWARAIDPRPVRFEQTAAESKREWANTTRRLALGLMTVLFFAGLASWGYYALRQVTIVPANTAASAGQRQP